MIQILMVLCISKVYQNFLDKMLLHKGAYNFLGSVKNYIKYWKKTDVFEESPYNYEVCYIILQ